ncbi:MAG: MBL fold metallo-hydrolase [Candidatus Berkelbacteria bacterium]|nr:MBL fold metallo-hydrolase [Candidatus Berkelbacteria bacterium]
MEGNRFSKYINFFIAVALLFAVFIWSYAIKAAEANASKGEVEITFLDVGEGDAILISLGGSTQILIDGGRDGGVLNPLDDQMPLFDKKIEYVVATHPDADHIGGLDEVFESYKIEQFIESGDKSDSATYAKLQEAVKNEGAKTRIVSRGDVIRFGGEARGVVLWPDEGSGFDSNNLSVVLKFEYKESCAILTGDAELQAQEKILGGDQNIQCELYKVPHHGAANGLDKRFIEKVKPKYAVISVGENNQYGHPTQAVLDSLAGIGAKILRTDELGTISFETDGKNWKEN